MLFFSVCVYSQTVTLNINQTEPLEINIGSLEIDILYGTSVIIGNDISVTGGTPPYEFSWNMSDWENDSLKQNITITPTDTTTFTCNVTDSLGCTQSTSIQVNVVFPLQLEITKTNSNCFGNNDGTISLEVSGGLKPYTINWDNGKTQSQISNLSPGEYAVSILDSMHQQLDTVITISEPEISDTVLHETICDNEFFQFGEMQLFEKGIYHDTIINSKGCDSLIVLNLVVNSSYTDTIKASICENETYLFGGTEISETGIYNNNLSRENGCDSIITCKLTVHPLPEIPVITQNGDTLLSSVVDGNQWYMNENIIDSETNKTLIITESGMYSVIITDENGCSSVSEGFTATHTNVATIKTTNFSCLIFPNPNEGLFTVQIESLKNEFVVLELYTIDGKLIMKEQSDYKKEIQFGSKELNGGVYTLKISQSGVVKTQKLVIQ